SSCRSRCSRLPIAMKKAYEQTLWIIQQLPEYESGLAPRAASGRYEAIRNACIGMFPNLPKHLLPEGVVVDNADGHRFGVWIMPDNTTERCLENFLKLLVPPECKVVWDHAEASVMNAQKLGCNLVGNNYAKAILYTWLAWQESPGQSPGIALTKKMLDPTNQAATSFVEWFRKLYQLQPKTMLFP
ncbi:MAG: DUF3226 domain-containing protein, partial [Terracidiphilus sp.]